MMSLSQNRRDSAMRILSGVLVGALFLSPTIPLIPERVAEAAYPVTETNIPGVITPLITTAGATAESALANTANTFGKEWSFDMIAWGLANTLIKQMIKSMTQWVNNGFEGSPAFVTDLEKFMRDTADEVAGQFIWESEELNFLCSPFAFDIKVALETQYSQTRDFQSQCTLSDVVGNMDNFLSGDFLEGGWDGWYELTQNPKSNPYGAFLDAQAALSVKIGNKQLYEQKLLDFGSGFFSIKDPNCKPNPDDMDNFDEGRCPKVTPGNVVQTQLNTALSIPAGRLQIVDELNELIGAVFSQLVSNIFSSAGGLLGSTDSSRGGNIFDRIDREPEPTNPVPTTRVFDDALEAERTYRDRLSEVVDMIRIAETYREDAYPDADEPPETNRKEQCVEAGMLPASLSQELTNAEIELGSTDGVILQLEELRTDFLVLTDPTSATSAVLAIVGKYGEETKPDAQKAVMNIFLQIQTSGVLHSRVDYAELDQQTIPRVEKEVADFIKSVDRACGGGGDDGGGG